MPSNTKNTKGVPSETTRRRLIAAFSSPLPAAECTTDNVCGICLEDFNASAEVIEEFASSDASTTTTSSSDAAAAAAVKFSACGHAAHTTCLMTWAVQSDTCPYCRQQLFHGVPRLPTWQYPRVGWMIPFPAGGYMISEEMYQTWLAGYEDNARVEMLMQFEAVYYDSISEEQFVAGELAVKEEEQGVDWEQWEQGDEYGYVGVQVPVSDTESFWW